MKRMISITKSILVLFILHNSYFITSASAQTSLPSPTPAPAAQAAAPQGWTLVQHMTVMPYITGSLNFMSGQAFPVGATGPGIGGGLLFDLSEPGHSGFMFDFAFQDMYATAHDGSCINPALAGITTGDTVDLYLQTANAYHYFTYLLFEPFLKIQNKNNDKGYFMIGASFGMPVLMETFSQGDAVSQQILWNNSPYGHRLRVDLRAGIGLKLGHIGKHDLVLEARGGYPLTPVITNYFNQCNGNDVAGDWRIITMQVNLGVRL